MISVDDALTRLFALLDPLGTEEVGLQEAVGRVLAKSAVATRTQPPFAASAMDGYAVRCADACEGGVLQVIGEAAAGHGFSGQVGPGQAVRIFTGAPVPEGADTILIQEDATRSGDRITVGESPRPGAYVRPAGGDFRQGDLLPAPRRLSPRDVALLAAMNLPTVAVTRRPVVALIPTGDELVEPGQVPGPDQILTSNNYGLAAMLTRLGVRPVLCPIARDTSQSLIASLDHAKEADIIVTLGGASVGDHDLVARVFGDQGLTLDFYKIAMRPGKPLMAGRLGQALMIGLPGNPVSAMVCGEIFLRPAIDAMLGLPARPRQTAHAILAAPVAANGPRTHYMRAERGSNDQVTVFENQDSSLLGTLARANCLVIRAPHAPAARAGDKVEIVTLD